MAGVVHRYPVVAALFLAAALSWAGLSPFSGFVGKLALIQAGFEAERWVVVGGIFPSLLTLFSMTKIWPGAFWGKPTANLTRQPSRAMLAATGAPVGLSLAIGLARQPLLEVAIRAAEELVSGDTYRAAVLRGGL